MHASPRPGCLRSSASSASVKTKEGSGESPDREIVTAPYPNSKLSSQSGTVRSYFQAGTTNDFCRLCPVEAALGSRHTGGPKAAKLFLQSRASGLSPVFTGLVDCRCRRLCHSLDSGIRHPFLLENSWLTLLKLRRKQPIEALRSPIDKGLAP
jgi:hypothetical protein